VRARDPLLITRINSNSVALRFPLPLLPILVNFLPARETRRYSRTTHTHALYTRVRYVRIHVRYRYVRHAWSWREHIHVNRNLALPSVFTAGTIAFLFFCPPPSFPFHISPTYILSRPEYIYHVQYLSFRYISYIHMYIYIYL